MKIGMIVAVMDEINAMLTEMGEPIETITSDGFDIRRYSVSGNDLYVAKSGAGEIYASAATQLLISKYGAELIVNFGICGGLTPEMSLCRTCVVEKTVHYDYDTSAIDGTEQGRYLDLPDIYIPADPKLIELAVSVMPQLERVICASADKFVADPEKKTELHEKFGASICEMESAGILLTANRCGVPALLIKAVSDSVSGGAEEFAKMACESARVCVRTMMAVIERI